MTMAQDGGKVVSLTYRPPLPQEILEAESTPGPWRDRKNFMSMTPAGIEPVNLLFVAQHCATAVPLFSINLYYHT